LVSDEQLEAINRSMAKYEVERDDAARAFFEGILDPLLVFRRASGKIDNKAQFIEGLAQPYPFDELVPQFIEIRRAEDVPHAALVTLILVCKKKGAYDKYFRNIRLFTDSGSPYGCQLTFWYNFEVP
jgi:hypothetical protein